MRLQGHRPPLVGPGRRLRPPRPAHVDIAWTYDGDEVERDGEPVAGRICFYNERTDIEVDGLAQARPRTPWSRSAIEEL